MLTIYGRANRFCDGISRRSFLRIGALGIGAGALTLADLNRLEAAEGKGKRQKAVINVFLGVLNLVPLLPFDGGHIALALPGGRVTGALAGLLVVAIPIAIARLYTGRLPASIIAHQINNLAPGIVLVLGLLGLLPPT
jgi:hypothetical protein